MTLRHSALAVASVAVLAAGVYLLAEVRATPATADVTPRTKATPEPPEREKPAEPTTEARPSHTRDATIKPTKRAEPTPQAADTSGGTPAPSLAPDPDAQKPNVKLEAVMSEANKAYDHGDFDEARSIALKVLAEQPGNVRMTRIIVSANCIDGDAAEAQKYFQTLPVADREQMRVRCLRYGVTFNP